MKVMTAVPEIEVQFVGRGVKFKPVKEALEHLADGLALPVECETVSEAQSLQQWVFQALNHSGIKYVTRRRQQTVYISKLNGNGTH